VTVDGSWLEDQVRTYPLLDSLIWRRSRRFSNGRTLNGRPLGYESGKDPEPLTEEEEAALAFAACGFTGYALGELPYSVEEPETGGGNILSQFLGRTAPSGDAMHAAYVFVINDEGTYLLKRPTDVEPKVFRDLADAACRRDYLEFYKNARVQISDRRIDVDRKVPKVPGFNQWSANQKGTTYFIPVHEMTGFLINVLLSIFDEHFNYYIVDETASFGPAGIKKYTRSKGGTLIDKPKEWRTLPIGTAESWLYEFVAIEQGAILQNLGLMTQAMGLGGFAHFAHHPWAWAEALGFDTKSRGSRIRFSKTAGMKWPIALLARVMGRDVRLTVPLGLKDERGEFLVKPFCPPCYKNMQDAVCAYVDQKFGPSGTLTDPGGRSGFKDPAAVAAAIPRPSRRAIEATIDCCEYVYKRFGRIPARTDPCAPSSPIRPTTSTPASTTRSSTPLR
jgi:hypothetical protein